MRNFGSIEAVEKLLLTLLEPAFEQKFILIFQV